MISTPRNILFFAGAVGMALLYLAAFMQLPGPEQIRNRYLEVINHQTKWQRHVTDAVTAVNFDYRGFDTLGEEFILFVSVMGTLVLLREAEEKHAPHIVDAIDPSRQDEAGDALRTWTLGMTGPTVLFGLYIVAHGQLTPGGGFQGGVVLASAPLLVYLAGSFGEFKRIASHQWVEIIEAVGAGGYAVIGALAWFYHREFLTNVLPLGQTNELFSGGTVWWINAFVGLEVAAGFVVLLFAFLQELLSGQESEA